MPCQRVRRRSLGGRPADAAVYRRKFVATVHRVLALASRRLAPAALAQKEETDITGVLVEEMRTVVQGRACPAGATNFSVHDDQPVSGTGVEGKRRPRIDIVVERTGPGPRPLFHFEAKRLHRSDSVAAYMGDEGMDCFLSGKYAQTEPDAGMLGYIQKDTPQIWTTRLATGFAARGMRLDRHATDPALPHTYRSNHVRGGKPFELFHVLLVCA
jgi:hypothetical protein